MSTRAAGFATPQPAARQLSVQIRIRQERQKSRPVDRHRELPLVARLGPGDPRRDDLTVLVDEILQDTDVLVVDLLDFLGCEAAELPAAEELPAPAAASRPLPLPLPLSLDLDLPALPIAMVSFLDVF